LLDLAAWLLTLAVADGACEPVNLHLVAQGGYGLDCQHQTVFDWAARFDWQLLIELAGAVYASGGPSAVLAWLGDGKEWLWLGLPAQPEVLGQVENGFLSEAVHQAACLSN
jgi:hypothetical protein